jgi:hypothetical protein
MPPPGRPHAPNHEALVVEGEPNAGEAKSAVQEPVMMPECKPVMEEPVVPECEVVMHESLVVHRAHMAHAAIVQVHSAVHCQRARRRGGTQGCHRSRSDEKLANHRVPPSGMQLRIDIRAVLQSMLGRN